MEQGLIQNSFRPLHEHLFFCLVFFFTGKEKKLSKVELSEEAKRLRNEYHRKYHQTEKFKEYHRNYQKTEKFKEYRKKWAREDRKKNPEKYKKYVADYWNRRAEEMKENKEGDKENNV